MIGAAVVALPLVLVSFVGGYYYVAFSRLIDAHLQGARARVQPRVFARPLELRRGQALTEAELVVRLNDLGYTQRAQIEKPGEFTVEDGAVSIGPRPEDLQTRLVRVVFRPPTPPPPARPPRQPPRPPRADRVLGLELGGRGVERVALDAPLLASLTGGEREKQRPVPLATLPAHVVNAVLAIEDRRYYAHPGVDPIGIVRAVVSNTFGTSTHMSGASTITQQVVRNVFLPEFAGWTLETARAVSFRRKLLEQFVALVLDTRASKDEVLEMYLNEMPFGQRGSFAIVGAPEAARLFFGKDITNVTLSEAATMAGVLQSPSALSPFNNPDRCRERRNVVLQAMIDAGFAEEDLAAAAATEPLVVVQRALEAEAPYFVDYVSRTLTDLYPGLTTTNTETVDVFTTLDPHLQRLAQDAVRNGLTRVDKQLAGRRRQGLPEAALLAVDPANGEILAMVGGRSYNQSQFNRAIAARRQPGSVFKPFVYLTAFEQTAAGVIALTPASIVEDSPTTWQVGDESWTPENYQQEYDGPITLRRALALSRNVAAVKVAEAAQYNRVAALWSSLRVGEPPRAYPSIALGVFEATPYEIATAYTIFPNLGVVRPLRHIERVERGGEAITRAEARGPRVVAGPASTYLVTSLMQSVVSEGTGASARAAGFTRDAAGKTGTTNDLRDAWFAGFTPELLTVVWVGFDDNQALGLSGSQAALPIWTEFMTRALSGHPNMPFEAPDGVTFVEIDRDTGLLATPFCPNVRTEVFLAGTAPSAPCDRH